MAYSYYPKDRIGFLYIHRENGDVAFISHSASRHVPVPQGEFAFRSIVASTDEEYEAAKQATRSIAPEINKYSITLHGSASCTSLWEATVYERYIGNGFEGVVFFSSGRAQERESEIDYLAPLLLDNSVMTRDCLLEPFSSHSPQQYRIISEIECGIGSYFIIVKVDEYKRDCDS